MFRVYVESEQAVGWIHFEYIDLDSARTLKAFGPSDKEANFRIVESVYRPAIRSLKSANFGGFAIRTHFNISNHADRLIYVKSPCIEGDLSHRFFLHVTPVHLGDLAEVHKGLGLGVRDFNAFDGNTTTVMNKAVCILAVTLPEYDIRLIYTGQVTREVNDSGEVSWKGPNWEGKAVIEQDIQ